MTDMLTLSDLPELTECELEIVRGLLNANRADTTLYDLVDSVTTAFEEAFPTDPELIGVATDCTVGWVVDLLQY